MGIRSAWAGLLAPLILAACDLYPKSSPMPDGEAPKFFTSADSAALFPGRELIPIPDKKGRAYQYFPPWSLFKSAGSTYVQSFRIERKDVSIRSGFTRCSNPLDAKALFDGYLSLKLFPGAEYKEAADLPGLKQGLDVMTSVTHTLVGYSGGVFYQVEIEPAIPLGSDGLRWMAGKINLLKGGT